MTLLLLLLAGILFLHLVLLSVTTRRSVLPANLLQAQRDYRCHTYERTDRLVTSTTAGTKNNNQINFDLTTEIYSRSFLF